MELYTRKKEFYWST